MSKSTAQTKPKTKTEIQFNFNEKSLEAYIKENCDIPHEVQSEIELISKFKAKAKSPIRTIIRTMNRRQVNIFDENGKPVKKEFLTYRVDYYSKDWLGNELNILSHIHGYYKKPTIIKNRNSGLLWNLITKQENTFPKEKLTVLKNNIILN